MKQKQKSRVLLVMILVLGGPAVRTTLGDHERSDSEEQTRCCFHNSRHSGVCVVHPGEEESCATVLDYLNNPSSSGKSYCNFTDIRGGWREISCQEASAKRRDSASAQIPGKVGEGPLRDASEDPTHEEADQECSKLTAAPRFHV